MRDSQEHRNLLYFEAFDARFKDGPIEQSWGLWRSDRTPKLIIQILPWRKEDRQ